MSLNETPKRKSLSEGDLREEENQLRFDDRIHPNGKGVSSFSERKSQDMFSDDFDIAPCSKLSVPAECEESANSSKNTVRGEVDFNFSDSMEFRLNSSMSLFKSPPSDDYLNKSDSPPTSNYYNHMGVSPSKTERLKSKSSNLNSDEELAKTHGSQSSQVPEISPMMFDIPLPGSGSSLSTTNTSSRSPKSKNNEENSISTMKHGLDLDSDEMNLESSCNQKATPNCKDYSPLNDELSLNLIDSKKTNNLRYSPSRLDSDEENQEFITSKPKVLGKEQAKKRLMAFSLSKQPSTPLVKKQNKLLLASKIGKEKPPNPNKSGGVQEQFRATISAIEEEKKRMMQNMPNYLFMYRNDLSKVADNVIPNTMQNSDKSSKDENIDPDSTTKGALEKGDKERSKYSPGKNKISRQRRSSSRQSSSRNKKNTKEREEHSDKKDNSIYFKKLESVHDWKSFSEAGFSLDCNFRRLKFQLEEKLKRKERRRSRTPENEYKPIFNILKKGSKTMAALQAKASNPNVNATVAFQEKTVKYTRTKPMITWAENPSYATDFFMPKQMLLENCDKSISTILYDIMEQRTEPKTEARKQKQKLWYPHFDYLVENNEEKSLDDELSNEADSFDIPGKLEGDDDFKDSVSVKSVKSKRNRDLSERTKSSKFFHKSDIKVEEKSSGDSESDNDDLPSLKPRERRISLVNDDYLSDEGGYKDPMQEMVVGDVKVQLDLGLNRVKVRSKWDSDYEGDENEKGGWKKCGKSENMEIETTSHPQECEKTDKGKTNSTKEPDVKTEEPTRMVDPGRGSPELPESFLEEPKGNLASEYEEFMKMVAFDSSEGKTLNEKVSDKAKVDSAYTKVDDEAKGSRKLDITDWDQESDREENLPSKKIQYIEEDTADSFSLLLSNYESKKKRKSKSLKKNLTRTKSKDKLKKQSKSKKKRYQSSSETSSDSSDSSDSDSDSDSDTDSESDSSDSECDKHRHKKRRNKKLKRRRYSSSSDSESDSDSDSKSKKEKIKKKMKSKKDKDISDSNDETQSVMLKQLDLKKQQIIKKIEEIDSFNGSKKKDKKKLKKAEKTDSSESEVEKKKGKKKKMDDKSPGKMDKSKPKLKDFGEKGKGSKRVEKDSSESDSDSVDDKKKGKKNKRKVRKKSSSESSSDDEVKENRSVRRGKSVKGKKKKVESSSSTDSDTDSDKKLKKRLKKRKKKRNMLDATKILVESTQNLRDWNDHLLSDGPDFKPESSVMENEVPWASDKVQWRGSTEAKIDKGHKEHRDLGDWEESSSEVSLAEKQSPESSWDDELPKKVNENDSRKNQNETKPVQDDKDKFMNEFNIESKHDVLFNESSLSNLGHELSRDLYSSENSLSLQLFPSLNRESSRLNLVEARLKENFQVISEGFQKDEKKPSKDELYSPGHTESDVSDADQKKQTRSEKPKKEELYDPLKSDSEESTEQCKDESNIIPTASELINEIEPIKENSIAKPGELIKSEFIAVPPATDLESASEKLATPGIINKKRMISVKLQQKLTCKVPSVFQTDSEDEEVPESNKKGKTATRENETGPRPKTAEKVTKPEESKKEARDERKKAEKKSRDRSRERSREKDRRSYRENERYNSPKRRRSRTPESKYSVDEESRKRERKEDFNRSPHQTESSKKYEEVSEADLVRPIPVLTGLDVRISNDFSWGREPDGVGYSCDRFDLVDPSQMDSYKLYVPGRIEPHDGRSEDLYGNKKYRRYDRGYEPDAEAEYDLLLESRIRKEKRSRSRSSSPRKRRRSKTPDRRRSPRHRSTSPRRRGRGSLSPRRRSPRRRYRSSRSPERKKSRSPRKRRHSPRRSRSQSPRKQRSRLDSPRRRSKSASPRKDSYHGGVRHLIHLIGRPNDDKDLDSPMSHTKYDSPMGFTRSLADSTISDSELNNAFYNRDYPGEYGGPNYRGEVTVNNLITLQNHDADKRTDSPKRLTLDQRIEIELGVPPGQSDQYQMPPQSFQQFPDGHPNEYAHSYPCDNGASHNSTNGNQGFYPNQNPPMGTDFNGSYYNGQEPSANFGHFHQYPRPPMQNSVLQVGNIMEVVPSMQGPPPTPHAKGHQIMQVGNVLQVVPSPKPIQGPTQGYGSSQTQPLSENSKPSVVLPQNNLPNPDAIINPLIKAIQLEREKRKKEKEKRRAEREARRKARQQRREAKLMAVNEKLKKSVQDEGLMLGQEVEEEELLEEIEHLSPPIPVEIVTDSTVSALPAAGKGILITAGFIPRPASEKKEVKFADGICPGEGTSTSGGEDRASPPPKPKLPKEKRYKKKKTKVKKKVKVHIIRQVIQADEDEDDLSPPPPPPGDPPPVFFARFPFGGKAQYPVYQTQTTTTTLTTVQFPTETYQ